MTYKAFLILGDGLRKKTPLILEDGMKDALNIRAYSALVDFSSIKDFKI